jgi:alpha-ketoglutarate-dependent taurine dioxygenase
MQGTKIEPLGNSGGQLIQNLDGRDLLDLPADRIREIYMGSGALIFRGYDVDPTRMKAFADQFSSYYNRDRLRPPVEGSQGLVQMVTEGMGYVEPHSEQANSPFRPDAIWFCCQTPAAEGGETLYWDGVRVWEALSPALKQLFGSKKLRFFQHYSPDKWRLFLGPESTLEDARKRLDGAPGAAYFVAEDESIYLEYVCPAVVKTRYGQRDTFCNSLLSERQNTLGELMTFHDGTPVTDEVVDEVVEVMERHKEEISWVPGDLAFIDNTRFMHGRNAYTDTRRKIFSSLSFLKF